MPQPRLIHPVPVVLVQTNASGTLYDPDTREPIQDVARTAPVTLQGQVNWEGDKQLRNGETGAEEGSLGYVVFRLSDLKARGIEIKREDRFTELGKGYAANVYVVKIQPMGHYPGQQGPTLLKVYFQDRMPTKRSAG